MNRCKKCEEWHVIDSTCKDCKRERERGEFIGLMTGDLSSLPRVKDYTDSKGMLHD